MSDYESALKRYFKLIIIVIVPAWAIIGIIISRQEYIFFDTAWKIVLFMTGYIFAALFALFLIVRWVIRKNNPSQEYINRLVRTLTIQNTIIILIIVIAFSYVGIKATIRMALEPGDTLLS